MGKGNMLDFFKFKFKKKCKSSTKQDRKNATWNKSIFTNSEYFIDGQSVTAEEYASCLAQHDDVTQVGDDYGLSYDGTSETECFADEDE